MLDLPIFRYDLGDQAVTVTIAATDREGWSKNFSAEQWSNTFSWFLTDFKATVGDPAEDEELTDDWWTSVAWPALDSSYGAPLPPAAPSPPPPPPPPTIPKMTPFAAQRLAAREAKNVRPWSRLLLSPAGTLD